MQLRPAAASKSLTLTPALSLRERETKAASASSRWSISTVHCALSSSFSLREKVRMRVTIIRVAECVF
jgi:hypothetical protein